MSNGSKQPVLNALLTRTYVKKMLDGDKRVFLYRNVLFSRSIYMIVSTFIQIEYLIDLENSTVENTELFDLELLGISPEERATVISSKDGLLTARFRDKDIEVVQFDDGGSNA